jgi:hypothetical protein
MLKPLSNDFVPRLAQVSTHEKVLADCDAELSAFISAGACGSRFIREGLTSLTRLPPIVKNPEQHADSVSSFLTRRLDLGRRGRGSIPGPCREYLEAFGRILHHNTDKGLLVAGRTQPRLGGGQVIEPMRFVLGDRVAPTWSLPFLGALSALDAALPAAVGARALPRRASYPTLIKASCFPDPFVLQVDQGDCALAEIAFPSRWLSDRGPGNDSFTLTAQRPFSGHAFSPAMQVQ